MIQLLPFFHESTGTGLKSSGFMKTANICAETAIEKLRIHEQLRIQEKPGRFGT
jgi:hypothetical protein